MSDRKSSESRRSITSRWRGTVRGVLRRVGRLVGLLTFTAVEVAALAGWFALVRYEPLGPASEVVGVSVLFGGLLLEGLLTHVTVNGRRGPIPAVPIALFSVTETLLWVGWLVAAEQVGGFLGAGAAGLALALLLVPQHTVEDNVLRGRATLERLLNPGTVRFSVLEAAGATAWLLLVAGFVPTESLLRTVGVGAQLRFAPLGLVVPSVEIVGLAVLSVVLFVEHVQGLRLALRPLPAREETTVSQPSVEPISFQQD